MGGKVQPPTAKFAKIDSSVAKTRHRPNKKPGAGPGFSEICERGGLRRLLLDVVALLGFRLGALGAARRLGEALLDELQGFGVRDLVDGGNFPHDPVEGRFIELTL